MDVRLNTNYEIAVYAAAIKAICDKYKLSQDDLRVSKPSNSLKLDQFKKHIRYVQRIPMEIKIPKEMLPEKDLDSGVDTLSIYNMFHFHDTITDKYEGLTEFEIYDPKDEFKKNPVRFWTINIVGSDHPLLYMNFVEKKNVFSIRKYAKRAVKTNLNLDPPVLPKGILAEIYKNTIEFLVNGKNQKPLYKEYNIPYKRGVLLCGTPGSGKTLTCRWLINLAIKKGLYHRVVTFEDYQKYRSANSTKSLFSVPKNNPGIIIFDDLDAMVKNRKTGNLEIMPFLTNMDGVVPASGVVFIFTTNEISELDEAFVRPGRIDLWVPFSPPGENLRNQFVKDKFHPNVLKQIQVDDIVKKTDGYTFAELDEIRKLFCFDLIAGKEISIERTFEIFDKHRNEFQDRLKIGFKMEEEENNWDDFDFDSERIPNFLRNW